MKGYSDNVNDKYIYQFTIQDFESLSNFYGISNLNKRIVYIVYSKKLQLIEYRSQTFRKILENLGLNPFNLYRYLFIKVIFRIWKPIKS